MRLKHPVNFMCDTDVIWPELHDEPLQKISDQRLSDLSGGTVNNWVMRTYYLLRLAGENVTLSDQLCPKSINVISVFNFRRRQRMLGCYLAVPQADAHPSMMADFRLNQNGLIPEDAKNATIWHWPQPGIVKRDTSRGNRIETLCFKGRNWNLDEGFKDDTFKARLKELGVSLELDDRPDLKDEHAWNDYSQSDAVLAVRNMTKYDAAKKPASKLVNAWFAECPAIVGPEPAFRELRQSEYDFIEVHSPDEAIDAVKYLQGNPDYYQRMIENGRKRREGFTEHTLTDLWIDVLNGPVAQDFEQWQSQPLLLRKTRAIWGLLKEPGSRKRDHDLVRQGERIMGR